jgi:hypothetical protein
VKAPTKEFTKNPVEPSPPTGGERITGLELIYTGAATHSAILTLTFGTANVIDLKALNVPTASFNLNAIRSSAAVQSVKFSNGVNEGGVPFAYCTNSGATYATCGDLVVGATLTMSVTPYPLPNQQGTPFAVRTATITIIDSRGKSPAAPASPASPPTVPSVCPIPQVKILSCACMCSCHAMACF